MTEGRLSTRIARGLTQGGGLAMKLRKGVALLRDSMAARRHLRGCDRVGPGARAVGRPIVRNDGHIEIGGGFWIRSTFAPVELVSGPGGRIEISDGVWLNFGTAVNAQSLVRIGARSHVGQYSVIADTEVPEADGALADRPRPIHIGEDVWIAGRVTVLPGATIGDGSVITAGSVVAGEIPAGVVAGGIPARVVRRVDGTAPAVLAEEPAEPRQPAVAAPSPRPAPAEPELTGIVLADFTADTLKDQLNKDLATPIVDVAMGPYGQVAQSLLGSSAADFAIVWTRPESNLESFRRLLDLEPVPEDELLADVAAFAALIEKAAGRFRFVFVPTWTLPPWQRGIGAFDAQPGGVGYALGTINRALADRLTAVPSAHVLDAHRWVDAAERGFSAKSWYLGKVPYHDEVFARAAGDIKAALRGLTGRARKLLVFDLDDTLWGGIVGDVGWEQLRLGGHDGEGEAYVDLQRAAKALTNRGVVLGLVSKNEESTALEAIRKHPEMVLREDDFVAHRINWQDKARNVAEIAAELNLGLQSVVFIDDNPVERARVREALPEVLVPEWPTDTLLYPQALLELDCFDIPDVTEEDRQRSEMYRSERRRGAAMADVGSLDDWLLGLGTVVTAAPLGPASIVRATQLLNKTNQMNLSTRRLSEQELQLWAQQPGHALWTVSVADRFGEAGLTGIVSLELDGDTGRIVDYLLSCRVMGRRVEETMLHVVLDEAARRGVRRVEARYVQTAKNAPCLGFLRQSGLAEDGDVFSWDTATPYPLPPSVTLELGG